VDQCDGKHGEPDGGAERCLGRAARPRRCGTSARGDIVYRLPDLCKETDQAAAALIKDLKQRGLLDSTLVISVLNAGMGVQTTFKNLPAIKFLADGTVDENSPQTLKLTDSDGFSRWLTETKLRTGYEITDTGQ